MSKETIFKNCIYTPQTMTKEKYQQLVKAIQKAQPDRDWRVYLPNEGGYECDWEDDEIRLADVLVALGKAGKWIAIDDAGRFLSFDTDNDEPDTYCLCGINWNLLKNNLDDQDEPTKEFLYKLLV